MIPAPPALFSTITDCPSSLPKISESAREEISVVPPGAAVTIILTGLFGKGSAALAPEARDKNAATAANILKHLPIGKRITAMLSPLNILVI